MKVTLQVDGRKSIKPTEGVPFPVNPSKIDRTLFQEKRENESQEVTRLRILKAFDEMDAHPEKYGKPFKTLMPEKTWIWKSVMELEELAANLGDHNANWVEQALEWAQRIQNGESWETICNEPDTANWFRLVMGKDGYIWVVGGSRRTNTNFTAIAIGYCYVTDNHRFYHSVPLVVLY